MAKIDTTVDRTGERWRYDGQYLWEVTGFHTDDVNPEYPYRGRKVYRKEKAEGPEHTITLGVDPNWEPIDEFKNWARRVRKDHGIETSSAV